MSGRDRYSKWSSRNFSDAVVAAFGNKASYYFGKSSGIAFSRKQNECYPKNPAVLLWKQQKFTTLCIPAKEWKLPIIKQFGRWPFFLWMGEVNSSKSWKLGILLLFMCQKMVDAHFQMSVTYRLPTDISFFHLSLKLSRTSSTSHKSPINFIAPKPTWFELLKMSQLFQVR